MSKYWVTYVPVGSGYIHKMSPNDRSGGGAFQSFLIRILGPNRFEIDTATYVEVLSPYNNKFQNDVIRQRGIQVKRAVVEEGTPLDESLIFGQAKIVLEALRLYEKEAQQS